MRHLSQLFTLIALAIFATSCNEKSSKKTLEDRKNETNFFSGDEASIDLENLKNEMEEGATSFLRSFSEDEIPWQKWDQSILKKAQSAQKPILALVGSSLGGQSRRLGAELSQNAELRKLVTSNAICTVVDTLTHPEIALLTSRLLNEERRNTQFPSLIWLTHEGSPLTTFPVGQTSGSALKNLIIGSVATVQDIWNNDSEYAVEHSRNKNRTRQKEIDTIFQIDEEQAVEIERKEVFRYATRQLSSLYSYGDRDLDNIGGLIPNNSLELLALGAHSQNLSDETRMRSRKAALEVSRNLIQEGIKDHLDGSYYYARIVSDWSIPVFAKNLTTQAAVAHMLLHVGSILDDESLITEGLATLTMTERNWLNRSISSISSTTHSEEIEKNFWDFPTLKEVLNSQEFPLAVAAFSLKQNGNIPAIADPLENYYQLNTLRRRVPLQELAKLEDISINKARASLATISQKLLKHRNKTTTLETEETLTILDLSLLIKAQLARAAVTKIPQDLNSAIKLANRLITTHYDSEKGLSRLPLNQTFLSARGFDYAITARSLILLHQATLDQKWLDLSLQILDEALKKLIDENGFLYEVHEDDRIIPLRQYSGRMILGESSLGVLDSVLSRAWAITDKEEYLNILKAHLQIISSAAKATPVYHSDFVSSCALGTHPLLAIVSGVPRSTKRQELLAILNSPKHLPFLSIRSANANDPSSPQDSTVSVTLTRNGKILGRVSDSATLQLLLKGIISGN